MAGAAKPEPLETEDPEKESDDAVPPMLPPEFGLKEKRLPPPGLRLTGTCGAAAEGGAELELGGRAVVAASIAKPKSLNMYSSPNNL